MAAQIGHMALTPLKKGDGFRKSYNGLPNMKIKIEKYNNAAQI